MASSGKIKVLSGLGVCGVYVSLIFIHFSLPRFFQVVTCHLFFQLNLLQ